MKLLIDTRAVAASRKPGFSKRQLAATLDENGIAYLHLQKLGTPAEGRTAARAGDMKAMLKIYEKQLKTPDAKEAMAELLSIVQSGTRVCLLCFERDVGALPSPAHRRDRARSAPAPQSTISRRRFSASFQKTPIAIAGAQLPRLRATALNRTDTMNERLLRR